MSVSITLLRMSCGANGDKVPSGLSTDLGISVKEAKEFIRVKVKDPKKIKEEEKT